MKVMVPLAEGFEEIEAVTIIDILRRASIDTISVYLKTNPVTGSHGITVTADISFQEAMNIDFNAIVLPGGMPGSTNLKGNPDIISFIQKIHSSGGYTAAICAAPIVLGEAGLLHDKKYTCYPGFETQIAGGEYLSDPVVFDGGIITGRSVGCAIVFALKLVEIFSGAEKSSALKKSMLVC